VQIPLGVQIGQLQVHVGIKGNANAGVSTRCTVIKFGREFLPLYMLTGSDISIRVPLARIPTESVTISRKLETDDIFVCDRSNMMPRANFHPKLFPHQNKGEWRIAVDPDRTCVMGE
jgi:hypothetical protein